MKNAFALAMLALLFLAGACSKDDDPAPNPAEGDLKAIIADAPVNPYLVAKELLDKTGWPLEEDVELESTGEIIELLNYRREVIAGDIVHYAFEIKMGNHSLDKIGIHRVVREAGANRPIQSKNTFFYQHGDAKDFRGMMLPGTLSPSTANDFGMAVFLARNDVDVWGIDQAWTLTPEETTDLSFMADWGLQKQVTDLRQAMAVARVARFLTGNGLDPVILAGYSSGVVTGYAALNEETQLNAEVRHASAFVAIDLTIKTDDPAHQATFEAFHAQLKKAYDSGEYAEAVPFQPVGQLARTDPDGNSPIFPGFTNMQAALFYGGGPIFEVVHFHYLAATWENDFPSGFQFLTIEQWLDFLESAVPFESRLFEVEWAAVMSDMEDLPYDDHFTEIRVPILNLSPAGSFGELSKYGTTLMGSTDITHVIPQLYPEDQALFDFAHIDLFIANNAEAQVWQPVLDWVNMQLK